MHARADTLGDVQIVESVRARVGAVDPFRVDIAIAAAVRARGGGRALNLDCEGHSRPVTVAAAVIAMSSLAFRRRDALIAAVVFSVPTVSRRSSTAT